MKNSKQLLGTSIIATLILSNAILGNEYSKDMKKYESTVNNQLKLIKQFKSSDSKNKHLISQKVNEINDLNTQLNQIKNENDNLKKKLEARKEVDNKRYYTITFYTNGYESTQKKVGDIGYGVTASGTKATAGRTIAAPESIPFGTKVYIEGIGTRVVEDRGGAIADGHIDVFVNDVNTARSLGKQTLLVEILD